MFNCKRGQMSIRRKISCRIAIMEHSLQNAPVLFCRMDYSNARLFDPALYAIRSFFQCQWSLMQAGICGDSNKCSQYVPTQTNRCGSA